MILLYVCCGTHEFWMTSWCACTVKCSAHIWNKPHKESDLPFPSHYLYSSTQKQLHLLSQRLILGPKICFCIGRLMIHIKIISISWVLVMICLEVNERKSLCNPWVPERKIWACYPVVPVVIATNILLKLKTD